MNDSRNLIIQQKQPGEYTMEREAMRDFMDTGLRYGLAILLYWGAIRGGWHLFKNHWADVATTEPNVIAFAGLTVLPALAWDVLGRGTCWSWMNRLRGWIMTKAFSETTMDA